MYLGAEHSVGGKKLFYISRLIRSLLQDNDWCGFCAESLGVECRNQNLAAAMVRHF